MELANGTEETQKAYGASAEQGLVGAYRGWAGLFAIPTTVFPLTSRQCQLGENGVVVAWIDTGRFIVVSHDQMRFRPDALPRVFDEDPIDAS